jgi:hypothetical protein
MKRAPTAALTMAFLIGAGEGAGEGNRTLMTSLEVRENGRWLIRRDVVAGRRGGLTASDRD